MIVAVHCYDECPEIDDVRFLHPQDNERCIVLFFQQKRECSPLIVRTFSHMADHIFIKYVEMQSVAYVFFLVLAVIFVFKQIIFISHIDHMRMLFDECVLHSCEKLVKFSLVAFYVINDEDYFLLCLFKFLPYPPGLEHIGERRDN